jgi:nucleotide-binding universal stress UspA family protein
VLPVLYDMQPLFPQYQQAAMLEIAKQESDVRAALARHESQSAPEGTELFVEKGSPYAEICKRAESWGADRIVVGSHGRDGLARVLLGSVAERVARHAHCSVLVARPSPASGIVLAASDLSDPSMPALAAGAAEAKRRSVRLVAVTAVDFWVGGWASAAGAPFGIATALPPVEVQEEVRSATGDRLRQAMQSVGADGDARVLDGSPAAAIAQTAEDLGAELVVVGTRGRTGLARLALGSVAERVIRSVGCSVLVVRLGETKS